MKKYTKHLKRSAYMGDPLDVARDVLLGAYLCTNINGHFCCGKITEVEAYNGDMDRACHAWPNKKTDRDQVMFEQGGLVYMYFIYGRYSLFNVVVGKKCVPHAILVRALEPIEGIDIMKRRRKIDNIKQLCNGPGKLSIAMGLRIKDYGTDLTTSDRIWISPKTESVKVLAGKRIGVDYAGPDKDLPWRFVIAGNPYISKPI